MALKIHDQFDTNPIIITDLELNDIIANNEVDDVIGVENDLLDLANSRKHTDLPIYIHVHSTNPFHWACVAPGPPDFWKEL